MTFDGNAIAGSGLTALAFATGIVGAFISGKIVAGKTHDRIVALLEKLTAAVEKRNDIDEAYVRELERLRGRG
ncbi:MAG TPA: hypothetical protein VGR85_03100 [Candidatus Limnocylindria bacterium]|nr:hypothetical protein [Candidatus Limnocylindria bacterium]